MEEIFYNNVGVTTAFDSIDHNILRGKLQLIKYVNVIYVRA